MHWYNPKTRNVEDVSAPSTDEEAIAMLRGDDINSGAFMAEYHRLRTEEGMGVEQAMIFVGHKVRLRYLQTPASGLVP
jgi:hypothetical protein